MGIPHLITHLRPYSTTTDLQHQNLIIDGPGFAYHIYHTLLSYTPPTKNPFESLPSYAAIGSAAVQWLEEVEGLGVNIKKIYFDGHLPPSKLPTRKQRLQSYTRQLSAYHESWPSFIPSSPASNKPTLPASRPASILKTGPHQPSTKLPALPFLVPSVLSALLAHPKFSLLTSVQPGEADAYCAAYVRTHGGIVVTGDSDLLVHDLGRSGSVAFFHSLCVTECLNRRSLRCEKYDVGGIVTRLGLREEEGYVMKALAFEMVQDPHASWANLHLRARALKAVWEYPERYEEWGREYIALSPAPPSSSSQPATLSARLQALDPRISEVVQQYLLSSTASPEPDPEPSPPSVFLPFLLDHPAKTSAWEPSTPIRLLAYSLLNLLLSSPSHSPSTPTTPIPIPIKTVLEHRRLASKAARGREWALPNKQEMVDSCGQVVDTFRTMQRTLGVADVNVTEKEIWRAMAWYTELAWASSSDKVALGAVMLWAGPSGTNSNKRLTWDAVHLSAILQACWYSFRILQQAVGVLMAARTAIEVEGEGEVMVPESVQALFHILSTLPNLSSLPSYYDDLALFGSTAERERYKRIVGLFEKQGEEEEGEGEGERDARAEAVRVKEEAAQRKKERKSKRKRQKADLAGKGDQPGGGGKKNTVTVAGTGTGTNMFALLDTSSTNSSS